MPPAFRLASQSPRRRELLAHLGLPFTVHPARVKEWEATDADPQALVAHNAAAKADAVAESFPGDLILAADTTVALDGFVLNKPTDLAEARQMLRQLAGRTHTVYTGVALRWGERTTAFVEPSYVTFKAFDAAVIDAYFAQVDPLDKAGAYGIQQARDLIIAGWEGSLSNIMGLPVRRLGAALAAWDLPVAEAEEPV